MFIPYFRTLWTCNSAHHRSTIRDFLVGHVQNGIALEIDAVTNALLSVKRPHVLDHYGCSPKALLLIAKVRPDAVASVFTTLAHDQKVMESLQLVGSVKAKKSGAVTAAKVRTILPMPALLGVIDHAVATRMSVYIDAFANTVPSSFLECARKRRQSWILHSR